MSAITLFGATFCHDKELVTRLESQFNYRAIDDTQVIEHAAKLSGIDTGKLAASFTSRISVFNRFTHERERSIACIRQAVAELLSGDNLIFQGYSGLLIPANIAHVLRVCLVAGKKFRINQAITHYNLSETNAVSAIQEDEKDRALWIDTLFKIRDPWDPSLYDIVIPVDKEDMEAVVQLIAENMRSEVIRPTAASQRAVEDFRLASRVGVVLAGAGHKVDVQARDNHITITINQNVLMLNRLEEELKKHAQSISGVESVETRIGKGFYKSDIYRKYDFDMPKLLLVDDEREFVHTLSERLMMRDVHSAVAYDGESALEILNDDEPDVIILDLKMPGIDGIEVLKKTKKTNPDIEVIILTGHGTEGDRKKCMSLGAFAYLQKPVDIDILTRTLKEAKEKMNAKKAENE